MTANERAIFEFFRRYDTGSDQMLFFNPGDCKVQPRQFQIAMQSLISQGLVVKERPAQAYSLTRRGYILSLSTDEPAVKSARRATQSAR